MARDVWQIVIRGGESIDRGVEDEVIDIAELFFVEIVADPGPVRLQILDGHRRINKRQLIADKVSESGVETQRSGLDQRHGGNCHESLGHARYSERRVASVGSPLGTVSESRHDLGIGPARTCQRDNPRKPMLLNDSGETRHAVSDAAAPSRPRSAIDFSRISTLRTLPVTVIGKSFTKWM